jgi:branched-chain amino acid transport system substrate-binding protein
MQGIVVIVVVIIAAAAGIAYYATQTPSTPSMTETTAASSAATSLVVGPPIKIALIPPLTGPAAETGKELQDGILFTYNQLKASGQIPVKVDGQLRDIQFIWLDSKSDPEEAVKAYTDAIVSQGADILGWNWHSSVALALYQISTKYGKIHFGDVGETQSLSLARVQDPNASRYWFKAWADPPCYASLFAPGLGNITQAAGYTPKSKVAALILEDSDYGRAMADALKTALTGYGWTVQFYDVFSLSPPESDFTPFIAKYMAANVGLVYQISTGLPSMVAFIKQLNDAGYKGLKASFGIGWFTPSQWYPTLGAASNYVLSMDSNAVSTPAEAQFIASFNQTYHYLPSAVVTGYWAHDLFSMLIAGLNQAGTLNSETLRSTLLSMTYQGIFMNIKFTENANPSSGCALGPMEIIASPQYFHFPLQEWYNGTPTAIWSAADAAPGAKWIPPSIIAPPITLANIVSTILVAASFVVPTTLITSKLPE